MPSYTSSPIYTNIVVWVKITSFYITVKTVVVTQIKEISVLESSRKVLDSYQSYNGGNAVCLTRWRVQ